MCKAVICWCMSGLWKMSVLRVKIKRLKKRTSYEMWKMLSEKHEIGMKRESELKNFLYSDPCYKNIHI